MGLKFCANLSFMFQEEPDLLKRFALAKGSGFDAVELGFPYSIPLEDLKRVIEETSMEQVLINTYPGLGLDGAKKELGFAAIPGREKDFTESLHQAIKYAKGMKCQKIHILAGIVVTRSPAHEHTYMSNLRTAARLLERENIVGVIEPISRSAVPNYYLDDFNYAASIVLNIGSPYLRLLLDVFHLQQTQGNITAAFRKLLPLVGHLQISQVPLRNEPSALGELNYKYIFKLLKDVGYKDWIGLEYKPLGPTQDSIGWIRDKNLV